MWKKPARGRRRRLKRGLVEDAAEGNAALAARFFQAENFYFGAQLGIRRVGWGVMIGSMKTSRWIELWCRAAALGWGVGVVWPLAAHEEVLTLDPLRIEGRSTDLIGEVSTASDGLVGAGELAARPFLRRGELLEVVPGVVITQHSGGGKANQYFLRGFNLDHGTDFALSVDGLPVNMRSHGHGQGYADLNFVIPELVETVRYRKGPFQAEAGDFSAAGSAEFHLVDRLPQGLAKVEIGQDDHGRMVLAETFPTRGGDATTIGAEATRSNGPWLLAEELERYSLMARHTWTRGAGTYALTALGYMAEWVATDQIPQRAVAVGALDRFGFIDDTDGGASSRASLSFDLSSAAVADAKTTLNAYALFYELDLFSNFTYFLDDEDNGDQFNQRDRRFVFGGEWQQARELDAGGRKLELSFGLQARHDAIAEVALHRTARRERLSTVRDDEVDETSAGLFADGTLHLAERWRVMLGVRADGYRFDVMSDTAANSGTRHAGIVSPKLGVSWRTTDKIELYANVGAGFHSNDARGAVIAVDPVSGDRAERVDPLVRAEGAEIGVRTSIVQGLVSTLAVWGLELDSELVFVGDAGGTEASGATRRYGVEWANFYQATRWLALDADVAFTHARYRDAGGQDRIANSISRVVTAGALVELPAGWFGAARLRYFGPQPLIEDNSVIAPSSTTVSARLGWRGHAWEFAVDVLNVLDRANNDIAYFYESRLANEPSGVGVEDLHFHPAEPRAVRVSAAYRF